MHHESKVSFRACLRSLGHSACNLNNVIAKLAGINRVNIKHTFIQELHGCRQLDKNICTWNYVSFVADVVATLWLHFKWLQGLLNCHLTQVVIDFTERVWNVKLSHDTCLDEDIQALILLNIRIQNQSGNQAKLVIAFASILCVLN